MTQARGIALVGNPGSGKSSIAHAMCEIKRSSDWQRLSFAGALKDEVAYALCLVSRLPSTAEMNRIRAEMDDPSVKDKYRTILQWWGTEWRRAVDPDYWVRVLENKLKVDNTFYVIDDCRFDNEREMLIEHGFVFVRLLDGPHVRLVNEHASEVDWKTWVPDFEVEYKEGVVDQAQYIIDQLGLVGAL